jgi:hypothetical protein
VGFDRSALPGDRLPQFNLRKRMEISEIFSHIGTTKYDEKLKNHFEGRKEK